MDAAVDFLIRKVGAYNMHEDRVIRLHIYKCLYLSVWPVASHSKKTYLSSYTILFIAVDTITISNRRVLYSPFVFVVVLAARVLSGKY